MLQAPRARLSHRVAMQMEPHANSHSFTKMSCITNVPELIIKEDHGAQPLSIMMLMKYGEIVRVIMHLIYTVYIILCFHVLHTQP